MPFGKCKLCLRQKELQDSHLIPAGVYRLLRSSTATDPNPMLVTDEWVGQTSRQITDYVFCADCEQLLNERGEKWVIAHLASNRGFPLYEVLAKETPVFQEGDFAVYAAADIPSIDADKVIHFGLGIFWKASVHKWRENRNTIQIELGPYREEIREFVLGPGSFPSRVALWVSVVRPIVPLLAAVAPSRAPERSFHMFSLYVPGVEFVLNVGKALPDLIRAGCVVSNPLKPIVMSPEAAFLIGRNYRRALSTARMSEKFAERRRKHGQSTRPL